MKRTPTLAALAAVAGTAAITLAGCSSSTTAGSSSSTATSTPTATTALTVRTVFSGKTQGWTQPDDLAAVGSHLFVAFQNGVDSKGGTAGKPLNSTLVEFELNGTIDHSWPITGKIDGLGADSANSRVVATVNEDGNSSLYTIGLDGTVKHYTYSQNPLPHGGGTDSVVAEGGALYISASAPSGSTGPAVFKVTLSGSTAQIASPAPFNINSAATAIGSGKQTTLALTDPDSSTMVPGSVPVVGGEFMLNSQGDDQLIFDKLGQSGAPQVLSIKQSVDDVAFPTATGGTLLSADAKTDSVDAITGTFTANAAYTAVTPGNANNAPANAAPNYFGTIDLATGDVTAVKTQGVKLTPHSLIYLP
ncbi:hypothetical protein KDK95_23565 [Actinospica sp. MGRD01-02]|uniref:DUF4394 domain-containing protein n=1 Tax=Actinospica acidithermotolerans TaxID=2828514 RepID=A0A941ED44_9ACTN|nr:hypothetical protein [Actinospica acidithermotolerans]MBR7829306.1 hypothetical protein [Actinospica acidithermotolerans]